MAPDPTLPIPLPDAPAPPPAPPLRRRLWLAGLGTLLLLATLAVTLKVAAPGTPFLGPTPGADLIPSYMAGSFVREGRPDRLMSFPDAVRFQAHLRQVYGLEQNGRTGPWLNPPWFAWLFVPLSALPWPAARKAWLTFNVLLMSGAVVVLCRILVVPAAGSGDAGLKVSDGHTNRGLPAAAMTGARALVVNPLFLPTPGKSRESIRRRSDRGPAPDRAAPGVGGPPADWRTWGLVPLLMVASMPFIQAMASQQNTFVSLMILAATASLWRRGLGLRAGLVAGLLLFKPQLAAVVAAALACSLGRRAILGLLVTASALLVATALTMPGALGDYLHRLPAALPWLRTGSYYAWQRQVTFQGFWRMLFTGPASGPAPTPVRLLWPACALAAAAALTPALWRAARDARAGRATDQSRDQLIAATIAATPLLMPYYMDYDLLLLAVPAVLFAAGRLRAHRRPGRTDRLLLAGWVVLFPVLFLNAAFAEVTRLSLTVPLLAGMAGLLAWRAAKPARGATAGEASRPGPATAPNLGPGVLPAAA